MGLFRNKQFTLSEMEKSYRAWEVTMREFLERIVDERDRQYDMRFRAAEIAVNAALAAQEKAVNAAFLASEKAIVKAEDSQKDYNQRSNEFRGQLDDQAKLLMQRSEALGLFKSGDDKLETMRLFFDSKLESQRVSFEKNSDALLKEIAGLRESRSAITGQKTGTHEAGSLVYAIIIIVVALLAILIPTIIAVALHFWK